MRYLHLLLALPLAACGSSADSGPHANRDFSVSGFTRVSNAAAADVKITTGDRFAVRASGSQKLLDSMTMRVDGNILRIEMKQNSWEWGNQDGATIDIVMPKIEGATIAGAGDMTVDRGTGDFVGDISGAGSLAIGQLQANHAKFSVSGTGSLVAAGTAERLDVSVGGAGSVKAPELTSRDADVRLTGAGSIQTRVDGDADVSVSGVGSVDLGERARCRIQKSGIGDVKCGTTS